MAKGKGSAKGPTNGNHARVTAEEEAARKALHAQIAAQEEQIHRRGFRQRIAFLLVVQVAVAVALASALFFVIWPQVSAYHQLAGTQADRLFWGGLVALGVLFFAILFVIQRYVYSAFDTLEELRLDVIGATQGVRELPTKWFNAPKDASEVDLFAQSLAVLTNTNQQNRKHAQGQMAAIIAALPEGVLALSPNGIVTVANRAARHRLGAGAVREGTSIFAALSAGDLQDALQEARGKGAPVMVELKDNSDRTLNARVADLGIQGGREAGFVLILEAEAKTPLADDDLPEVPAEEDDSPPPMIGFGEAGPGAEADTAELPFFAMAMATTMEPGDKARVVSLAAVRLHGRRIYHQANFDRLVNPDMLIPIEASRVHGITNFQVNQEPLFPSVWEDFEQFTHGGIIIGYGLDQMLSVMDGELTRAGLGWDPVMTIDIAHLHQRMTDDDVVPSLAALAHDFGLSTYGQGTAMGDALIAAEIFVRQLGRLRQKGITSYGPLLQMLEDTQNPIAVPGDTISNAM